MKMKELIKFIGFSFQRKNVLTLFRKIKYRTICTIF